MEAMISRYNLDAKT